MKYDVFISHASEDKSEVARPLANHLIELGLRVWIDDFELTLGDSLRRSIDRGLAESRFGIIILSPDFFRKEWPRRELDGLVAKEADSEKVILPVWHNINKEDVTKFSPILADKLAVSTNGGIEYIAKQVLQAISQSTQHTTLQMKIESQNDRRDKYLSQIRTKMLAAGSLWDLREAAYQIEEFLGKYPNYYEAQLLKDEIQAAVRRERVLRPPSYERAPSSWGPRMEKRARLSRLPLFLRMLSILIATGGVSYLLYLLVNWILEVLK